MCGLEGGAAVLAAAIWLGAPGQAGAQLAAAVCARCVDRVTCLTDTADRLHDVADVVEGIAERGDTITA